jgi:hypothetical protein
MPISQGNPQMSGSQPAQQPAQPVIQTVTTMSSPSPHRQMKTSDIVSIALFLFTILSSGCAIVWQLSKDTAELQDHETRIEKSETTRESRAYMGPELEDHSRRLQDLETNYRTQDEVIQNSLNALQVEVGTMNQKVDDLASKGPSTK